MSVLFIGALANAAVPLARWEFDADYSDALGSFDLAPNGTVPFVPGTAGSFAADFDGGSVLWPSESVDFVQAASGPAISGFNATGLSIMGWVRHDQTDDAGSSSLFINQSRSGQPFAAVGYGLGMGTDGRLSFNLTDPSDGRNLKNADVAIAPNVWTHFAVTWDGSLADGVMMYLDGAPIASTPNLIGSFTGLVNNGLAIRVGAARTNSANLTNGLDGQLDHLSLWQGVLTPAEILADHEATRVGVPALGFWWAALLAWLLAICGAIGSRGRLRSFVGLGRS